MFECKGCGASLRFDIASQKLKCDHCGTEYGIDEGKEVRVAGERDAGQEEEMEVYSFECPQCGGTVYGDRQDMTGFCRYCGTPVELAGRLAAIERPKFVIPFQKTKEDCKKIFQKMVRRNLFLPNEYKDAEHIDSFRGIYMPYYLYHVDYDGEFSAGAKGRSYRRGDYIYTERYRVQGNLKGAYEGFEHDSSTTFSDEISEAIGPFLTEERVDFQAGYLSGFYADASDEKDSLYQNTAGNTANQRLHNKISKLVKKKNRAVEINSGHKYLSGDIRQVRAEKAMYPVWFMSYRNGDRVAYAAVNGQTGKITADLPIDFKKFLILSAVAAVPLFLLLNLFSFVALPVMLVLYSACCTVCTAQLYRQAVRISEKDHIKQPNEAAKDKKKGQKGKKGKSKLGKLWMFWSGLFIFVMIFPFFADKLLLLIPLIVAFLTFWFAFKHQKERAALQNADVQIAGTGAAYASTAAVLAGLGIVFLHPVSDLWYYGGCLLLLGCVLAQLLMIVKNHNYLATRRPVQFRKEGGDDLA